MNAAERARAFALAWAFAVEIARLGDTAAMLEGRLRRSPALAYVWEALTDSLSPQDVSSILYEATQTKEEE